MIPAQQHHGRIKMYCSICGKDERGKGCAQCNKKASDNLRRRQEMTPGGSSCSPQDEKKAAIEAFGANYQLCSPLFFGPTPKRKFLEDDDARSNTAKLLEDAVTSFEG